MRSTDRKANDFPPATEGFGLSGVVKLLYLGAGPGTDTQRRKRTERVRYQHAHPDVELSDVWLHLDGTPVIGVTFGWQPIGAAA